MRPFHEGELQIQRRAGVKNQASRVAGVMRSSIPPAAAHFLQEQQMVVAASVAEDKAVWASFLFGKPGFAHAIDDHFIEIEAEALPGDPLRWNLHPDAPLGILAIDLATRRRAKFKGALTEISTSRAIETRTDSGGREVARE